MMVFLAFPATVLAQKPLGKFEGVGGYLPEVSSDEGGLGTTGTVFATFFSNILGFLTLLSGIFFLVYFLVGGLTWLTASGKHEQVEKAKQSMTNAAVGLIIVVAAYGIAFIIGRVLGLDILDIGAAFQKIGAGGGGE
jgi:hypothetical protein